MALVQAPAGSPSSSVSYQDQFKRLIGDAVCSMEILLQAKEVKLTADTDQSSKHISSDDKSTITEALQHGARKAVGDNEQSSELSRALLESDTIVAFLESILLGGQHAELSDCEEKTELANVTESINALEDFCKVLPASDMKEALNQLANLSHILTTFYSLASDLFFCELDNVYFCHGMIR